ncbi:hypothetical protein AAG570_010272 [Ranatra chinensis]|uniref:Uncharacterized protein n=1 Tax=Ranatra chinensis TaxID=642074 RepID=A0ABD0YM26_9HEMI
MKILHTYMFYLIYGYNGNENLDQKIKYEILEGMGLDKSLADEMAFVYNQTDDWKMFIPPLPVHQDYCEGWCLMSDLLLRLPLCLFVALSNVPYNIPNLVEYIQHPIRKYYLVKYLPSDIANHLTIMRKYIFSISDIILRLCYIGLVQMGPQRLKEKDQVFIYLNRNACLLDTTSSEFGYNHISQHLKYEQLNYTFKTLDDVDQYWYDLWNIAMNTNLGCRNVMTGQAIVLEPINTKSVLVEAAQSRTPAEARDRDVGYIPGDGLGAVGLDSDMFVHLKRNWYWNNDVKCEPDTSQKSILDPPSIKRVSPRKKQFKLLIKAIPLNKTPRKIKIPEARHPSPPRKKIKNTSETELLNMNMLKKPAWKRANKAKKVTRIMKPKTSKHGRKPYYDQVDREALRRMVKLRVDWSLQEDNLLLICKVASLYMCPDKRRQVLKNFCAVREILHETFPETSRNKTSRACQRRQLYMMKNPSTTHSVYLCLEEIKQDDEITEKFEKAVENLDAEVKAQGEGIMTFQEKYDEIFINLVRTLMRKLKTVERNEKTGLIGITIPNTKQEFYNMFNIIIPRNLAIQGRMFNEVQNTVDIICGVVNTVIHSSLCCSGDKTNYSYQLFHIYQQYPDKLLRSVMAKCRSMSIVSCRKKSKRWKTTCDACLPLSSSPYQLSITLQEIFNKHKKQEISLIADSSRAISSAKDSTVPLDNPESDQLPENKDLSGYIELEVSSGGGCANIVELYSAGFVNMKITFPEHLIILDPRLSEDKDNYFQLMERFRELISMSKGSRKTRKDRQLTDGKNDEDDDEDDFEDEDAFSDDCDEFNLASKAGVAKAASRLAVYMMRDEPLESLDKTLQHAHDYFVLNPCKVLILKLFKKFKLV